MLTAAQIQTHVEGLGPPPPITPGAPTAGQVCTYYKAIRPLLEIVISLPFLPAIKPWLTGFVTLMDQFCPGSQPQ